MWCFFCTTMISDYLESPNKYCLLVLPHFLSSKEVASIEQPSHHSYLATFTARKYSQIVVILSSSNSVKTTLQNDSSWGERKKGFRPPKSLFVLFFLLFCVCVGGGSLCGSIESYIKTIFVANILFCYTASSQIKNILHFLLQGDCEWL